MSRRWFALFAGLVSLVGMSFVSASSAAAAGSGSISGSVSGPPLAVCVTVVSLTSGATTSATTVSGNYTITGLAADNYAVFFDPTCDGSQSSSYETQWYDGSADLNQASVVALTVTNGEAQTGIDATLIIGGTITGAVTSASADANGICVYLYRSAGDFVTSRTVTGGGTTGSYTIANLPPGEYGVFFDPSCSDSRSSTDETLWYDNQSDASSADLVDVTTNHTNTLSTESLAAGASITGTVVATGATSSANVCVIAFGTSADDEVGLAATGSNGSYDITNLPGGTYRIEFDPSCLGLETTDFAAQWYSGVSSFNSASGVTVGTGGVVGNIDGTLSLGVTPLSISTSSLPSGSTQDPYSTSVSGSGGNGPYEWVASGLPPGLSMSASTGAITGTPTSPGNYSVSVTVTDASSQPISATTTIAHKVVQPERVNVCHILTKKVIVRHTVIRHGKKVVVITHKLKDVMKRVTIRHTVKRHGKKVVVITHKLEPVKVCKIVVESVV